MTRKYIQIVVGLLFLVLLLATIGWSQSSSREQARSDSAARSMDFGEESAADIDATADMMDESMALGAAESPRSDVDNSADLIESVDAPADDAGGELLNVAATSPQDRQVIRTAYSTINVEDGRRAFSELQARVESVGGFLTAAELQRDDLSIVTGPVTFRIPADLLMDVVNDLDDISDEVPELQISETDVSNRLRDLDIQIENLELYEQELRILMSEVRETSNSTDRVLEMFEQVNAVRVQIETLQAERTSLGDLVALSTLTVYIDTSLDVEALREQREEESEEPEQPEEEEEEQPWWQPSETFDDAWTSLQSIVANVGDGAIWFAIVLLPVLLLLAAGIWLVASIYVRAARRLETQQRTSASHAPAPAERTSEQASEPDSSEG